MIDHTGRDMMDISRYYENDIIRNELSRRMDNAGIEKLVKLIHADNNEIIANVFTTDYIFELNKNAKYETDYKLKIETIKHMLYSIEHVPEGGKILFIPTFINSSIFNSYDKNTGKFIVDGVLHVSIDEIYDYCEYSINRRISDNNDSLLRYYIKIYNYMIEQNKRNTDHAVMSLSCNDITIWSKILSLMKLDYYIEEMVFERYVVHIKK